MPRTTRFYLDEKCDRKIARALPLRLIDVTTMPEVGLRGVADETYLDFARRENRVLVTHDHDHLVLHSAGIPRAGIVYRRQDRRTIGEIREGIELI